MSLGASGHLVMDGGGPMKNHNDIRYRVVGRRRSAGWTGSVRSLHGERKASTLRGRYLKYNERVVYDLPAGDGVRCRFLPRLLSAWGSSLSQEEIDSGPAAFLMTEVQVGDLAMPI